MQLLSSEFYAPTLQIVGRLLSAETVSLFLVAPDPPARVICYSTSHNQLADLPIVLPADNSTQHGFVAFNVSKYYFDELLDVPCIWRSADIQNGTFFSETARSGTWLGSIVIPLRHRKHKCLGIVVADNKLVSAESCRYFRCSWSQIARETGSRRLSFTVTCRVP